MSLGNDWYSRETLPSLPDDFPILSQRCHIWKTEAIYFAIAEDNLPEVHELIRLLGPEVLYVCDMGWSSENLTPTALHMAAKRGRMDILTALLDYRDSLLPDERKRWEDEYERDEKKWADEDPYARPWGTPLTEACMSAQADAVQMLLARMPEVDVNASDKFGFTPLQAVAKHAVGVRPHTDPDEPARRMAIVKMLLAKGAVPRSTDGKLGRPNPLLLTLMADRGQGDAALTRFFIDELGINVHASFSWSTARLDGRGVNGVTDDDKAIDRFDSKSNDNDVYLSPLATAALFGNAAGVETLLRTPITDFVKDLVPATGLPPLHAAVVGVPHLEAPILEPGGPEPTYHRPVRFVHNNKVFLQQYGQWHDTLSNEEREAFWAAYDVAGVADRAAYIDARVATVQLLVSAVEAVSGYLTPFDINATHSRYTPLHLSARFDRLPLLRVLLDHGADPNIPIPGEKGKSVLATVTASVHRLCARNSRVAYGQPWQSGGGAWAYTPYSVVVQSIDARIGEGMTTLLRELSTASDDVNEVDADGNTALYWTSGYGLPNTTKALLVMGARPDAQNHAGEVPTDGTVPTTTRPANNFRDYD
ncbi:Palmitoyltransferase zdhhc13 [Sporothrix stenoceras]|uniref:Palmitoyltransferase zdhhc13 n=1 Tax=Sporothrix stenoceras TaxID=5173 RepID=A0ABR3YN77_9PEZI